MIREKQMRLLGIDIGEKKIGVAMSDILGSIASPVIVIQRQDIETDIGLIKDIIEEYNINEIVAGLPRNMDGSLGQKAVQITEFTDNLKEKIKIPVTMWDERLTTVAGERVLIQGNVSRKKRKKVIDKIAACIILQSYLDSLRYKNHG